MNKKVLLGFLLLCAVGMAAAWAGDRIGDIIYFAGDVTIARNGGVLGNTEFNIGDGLEDYDLIRTGPDGMMDLIVRTPQNREIQVQVQNNTSFYIEINRLSDGGDRTTFEMMTGTLGCKVDKLSGEDVQVKTKSAAMGVKGTKFKVSTAPTDDMLVSCDEGSVSCIDENGDELYAKPGAVVEKLTDERKFQNIQVSKEELDNYSRGWFVKRLEVFRANAPRVIQSFALRFDDAYDKLVNAYNELLKKKSVLEKWVREDKSKTKGSDAEVMNEKKQIIGGLFKIKAGLFIFERIYFRILELEYYFSQGYGGSGDVKPGLPVKQFFANLQAKKRQIETMVSNIQYFFKLYAIRNNSYFPVDALGLSDDKFFDSGTDFFK